MRGCHQEIGLMAGSEPGYNHWRLSLSSSAAITSAPPPPHGVGVDCRWCRLLGYQLLVIFSSSYLHNPSICCLLCQLNTWPRHFDPAKRPAVPILGHYTAKWVASCKLIMIPGPAAAAQLGTLTPQLDFLWPAGQLVFREAECLVTRGQFWQVIICSQYCSCLPCACLIAARTGSQQTAWLVFCQM